MSDNSTQEGTLEVPFNPKKHLTTLKSSKGDQEYLEVKWRLVWFVEQCPEGKITILHTHVDPEQPITKEVSQWNKDKKANERVEKTMKGFAWFHVRAEDGNGRVGEAIGSECALDFEDYPEKAQTKAMGRALAEIGYGTQFDPTLNELPRIVDAPVDPQPPQDTPPPPIPPTTPKTKTPAPVGGETGTEKRKASAPIPASPSTPTPVVTSTPVPAPVPVDLAVLRQQANETLTTAAPYEAIAILSWSGIEETNPEQWSAEMCRLITSNTEKWFDGEHHDQWIAKPITQKQYDEITKAWAEVFGSDAIKALKTSLFGETCPPVSKLTRGQADMLVEQLRNAEPTLVDGKIVPKRETVTLTAAAA